jgi:hypothetical protein
MMIIFFSFIKYFKLISFNINLSLNYNKFNYLKLSNFKLDNQLNIMEWDNYYFTRL